MRKCMRALPISTICAADNTDCPIPHLLIQTEFGHAVAPHCDAKALTTVFRLAFWSTFCGLCCVDPVAITPADLPTRRLRSSGRITIPHAVHGQRRTAGLSASSASKPAGWPHQT